MKLRFLHLADVHLGCSNFYLAERAQERNEDFKTSFRDAIEFALEARNGVDGVLIAGNLFEQHRPDAELWSFVKGLLSRLLAKNVLVAMVPGHHDSFGYKNSVFRTERLPGVELLLDTTPGAPRVHDVKGTRVFLYGLAFVPGQTPQPLPPFRKAEERGVHLALVHGCTREHPEFEERPHQLELDLDVLARSGFDYVALGGFRSYQEFKRGDTTLVYPGSLEGRGFEVGETGDKGPVIVEIDDKGVHLERMITNRKSISRVVVDLRDERITDAAALKNAINTFSGRNVIAEVTLTGTAEFVPDLEEIRSELTDSFYHLEIRDESGIVESALLRKIESENTIRGYLVRKLGERITELKARMSKKGQTAELVYELRVLEKALKIGVEQFVEEEAPPDSIYSLIPDSDEIVEPKGLRESVGVGHLEEKVKAMLEYRKRLGEGGAKGDDAPKAKASTTPANGAGRPAIGANGHAPTATSGGGPAGRAAASPAPENKEKGL